MTILLRSYSHWSCSEARLSLFASSTATCSPNFQTPLLLTLAPRRPHSLDVKLLTHLHLSCFAVTCTISVTPDHITAAVEQIDWADDVGTSPSDPQPSTKSLLPGGGLPLQDTVHLS